MQELVTTLLARGETFREAVSPYRWLCRAAERASLDQLRRGRRARQALPLEDVDVLGAAPGVDAEARRAVLESLERLFKRCHHPCPSVGSSIRRTVSTRVSAAPSRSRS